MTRTRLLYQFLSCHSSEAAGSRAKCRFLDQRCGRGQGAQEAAFPIALSHPASSGQDSPQGGENSGGLRRWGAFRSPCFSGSLKSCPGGSASASPVLVPYPDYYPFRLRDMHFLLW